MRAGLVVAEEQAGALRGGGAEGGVAHGERGEGALGEELRVRLVRGGFERVAEQVEADVGVACDGSGRCAETLTREPGPALGVVGEGEVRRVGGGGSDLAREACGVGGEVAESDGAGGGAVQGERWDFEFGWGEALERVVEADGLVGHHFDEEVGGEGLGEGAEAEDGGWRGELAGVGGGFAKAAEVDLAIADDYEDHGGGVCGVEDLLGLGVGGGEGLRGLGVEGCERDEHGCGERDALEQSRLRHDDSD